MTPIRCPVNEAADTSRHEPALITGSRKILYSEYDQYLGATAQRLEQAGVSAGDRVALLLPNRWELAVLILALFRLRAVACPLSPELSASDAARASASLGCKRMIGDGDVEGLVTLFAGEPMSGDRVQLDADQPATVLPSGSGRAVLHSFGSHYYGALGANQSTRSSSGSRWLLSAPLHQAMGVEILIQCALSGAAVVLPDEAETLESAIIGYGVTHVSMLPAQLEVLLRSGIDGTRVPGLRAVLLHGAAIAPALVDRGYGAQLPLYVAYSLPEMTGQVAAMRLDTPPSKRHTSGRVLKYREVRIAPDSEILVRGRPLFEGYVEPGRTSRVLDADGWFATGDLGTLDADGYLTVTGRKNGSRAPTS